jgi:hypothetical protein
MARWLDSIFGDGTIRPDGKAVQEALRSATEDFDFLCPNYIGIPLTPLLLYLRNRSGAATRLLLIAHAPGAYVLELALLRPLLRSGDVIIAPTNSARDIIEFLSPELAAYTRVVPHPMRPLPCLRVIRRPHLVSLTRMHASKLVHRQIEAMALLWTEAIRCETGTNASSGRRMQRLSAVPAYEDPRLRLANLLDSQRDAGEKDKKQRRSGC